MAVRRVNFEFPKFSGVENDQNSRLSLTPALPFFQNDGFSSI